ncbi:MAG: hypothetical protein Q4F18_12730 [Clostridia bacterium]|nr:hypothetical protein [Clostridia bacterium]
MRILALPAALALAFCLYLPFPRAAELISRLLARLYGLVLRLFTRRDGRSDQMPALLCYLLLLAGVATLLGALHPAASAVLMAPLFAALSLLPQEAAIKLELDSGAYAGDIPAYESRVRAACASLGPAFANDACAPLLLCALGTPLYLGCALGWMYLGLRAVRDQNGLARRMAAPILRASDAVFCALMLLSSGAVGRSPLRTQGRGARERLLSILGISGDGTGTHAPMAGDIAQGIFLCCLCTVLLCLMLTAVFFLLC